MSNFVPLKKKSIYIFIILFLTTLFKFHPVDFRLKLGEFWKLKKKKSGLPAE